MNSANHWRIAFIVPRYGEDVIGGAETLARYWGERIVAGNLAEVELLTTCARDHITWKNELPAGETVVNGVNVRRFPIGGGVRDISRYHDLHVRLLQRQALSREEEYEWIDQNAHSPGMYAFIEKTGKAFDFLIFVPYVFGTTYYGSAIYPERSILWPCLHDETYAYLNPTREMFSACLGVMFNSYPEARLARRLYGTHRGEQIIGVGLSAGAGNAERFRRRFGIRDPFLLYAGRIESTKNVPLLVNYFLEYKNRRRGRLKLLLMGRGPETVPTRSDIVRMGFLSVEEKWDAYQAAMLLCQPSINESFSIVIMESWLTGVPVLVNAACEVTRYHVRQSNGGLYFRDYDEFEAVIDLLTSDDPMRQQLGGQGKRYVQTNYNWDVMLDRLAKSLEYWESLK